MLFFRKKEKESNVIETKETVNLPEDRHAKFRFWFLLWNIVSISLYTCYAFFVIYKLSYGSFLKNAFIYILVGYAIAFVLLIILNMNNQKKLGGKLKNYKSATKFLKYIIQLINFVLSCITFFASIGQKTVSFSSVLFALGSLVITIFNIFLEIAVLIIRKNIPLIKQNFLELRDKKNDQ